MTDDGEENGGQLLQRTAVAVLAATVAANFPELAPAAAAMIPMGEVVAAALGRIGRKRVEHGTEALVFAVEASGNAAGEFIDRATADDRRIELLSRTLFIAQDTALREKRRALGRALAAGVAGDDAKIDDELLFIRAVADLGTPHIKLLARLADGPPLDMNFPLGYWDTRTISARMPDLRDSMLALIAGLELHGLIGRLESSTPSMGSRTAYVVTALGKSALQRLADSAAAADGSAVRH